VSPGRPRGDSGATRRVARRRGVRRGEAEPYPRRRAISTRSRPEAVAAPWPKLRATCLLDALEQLDGRATLSVRIHGFVDEVAAATAERARAADVGVEVRLHEPGVLGSTLELDGVPIQLSAFTIDALRARPHRAPSRRSASAWRPYTARGRGTPSPPRAGSETIAHGRVISSGVRPAILGPVAGSILGIGGFALGTAFDDLVLDLARGPRVLFVPHRGRVPRRRGAHVLRLVRATCRGDARRLQPVAARRAPRARPRARRRLRLRRQIRRTRSRSGGPTGSTGSCERRGSAVPCCAAGAPG
jgi:hypothetical protein